MRPLLRRRAFLLGTAGAAVALWNGLGGSEDSETPLTHSTLRASGLELSPTPACEHGRPPPTPPEIEGPYYTPSSPERSSLAEPSLGGVRLRLVGRVVDTECRPVPGAVLDFWQADARGHYDNEGFRLRGHQFSAPDGTFSLDTIKPGAYAMGWLRRTPHLHVKVQGPGAPLLTTQLYFPDHAEENRRDALYHHELLLSMSSTGGGSLEARFDFVLRRGRSSERT